MKAFVISMAIVFLTGQSFSAGIINGSIGFTGSASLNTGSAGTATAVNAWNATVSEGTGSFASLSPGTPVAMVAPWYFYTYTPIPSFWSVGGFQFELASSVILSQGSGPVFGFVSVSGTGIVSAHGYTPTAFSWSFACQDPSISPGLWVFSASAESKDTNGAPVIATESMPGAVVLSWSDPTFKLQSATSPAGPFSYVSGATSPYTSAATGAPRFFRLEQPPSP
jgi:hypothetical protein